MDPDDGRLYGINPEFGVFGVAKDTNETTNPAGSRGGAGNRGLFTNVAYNEEHPRSLVGGQHPDTAGRVTGWRDWTGADRRSARVGQR